MNYNNQRTIRLYILWSITNEKQNATLPKNVIFNEIFLIFYFFNLNKTKYNKSIYILTKNILRQAQFINNRNIEFGSVLKGSVREKWQGYMLISNQIRYWSLLVLILSVASFTQEKNNATPWICMYRYVWVPRFWLWMIHF